MEASCWVARKIFLSAASASSSARTLDSRPTTNGVIMKGKMTTSRMGIIGSFLLSNFSLDVVTQSPLGTLRRDAACNVLPAPFPLFAFTGAAGRDVASYVSTTDYLILTRLLHHGERS